MEVEHHVIMDSVVEEVLVEAKEAKMGKEAEQTEVVEVALMIRRIQLTQKSLTSQPNSTNLHL